MGHDNAPSDRPSTDPRAPIDVRLDTPGREGLTGTTAANMYKPLEDAEQITIAPDWRPMEQQPAWRGDFPIDWPHDHYVVAVPEGLRAAAGAQEDLDRRGRAFLDASRRRWGT